MQKEVGCPKCSTKAIGPFCYLCGATIKPEADDTLDSADSDSSDIDLDTDLVSTDIEETDLDNKSDMED
ncbi:MAG: hypothetical protein FK730_10990 [Asgard group archaeon]|nr:hypothetical protein [Asgard group archaeon]